MDTNGKPVTAPRRTPNYALASSLLHLLLLAALIHQSASWIAPIRLPGSPHGTNLLLTYSPGKAPLQTSAPNPKTQPRQAQSTTPLPTTPTQKPKDATASPNISSPASTQPDSAAGADSLGSGNINIALLSYFPTPKPDLTALPRGTKGDVILDIVIDTTGKIADIKMTSGLGHGIDENVIATVQQWTFHPATKDGQPVASEQELHFHYEKA
ncbi:energy transducer TonB [Tunturibacter empetritectus]|uniref:Protein TonB n=1 Tax=Tunturiibacter empetritectus TaxID=3069691 RepID=A0A7W8IKK6_9BACT|nr:energy transducer TonB [Edaphobacter lichenicola]MBB5318784.1 protein TonB [Edaphobacter lichenicola]